MQETYGILGSGDAPKKVIEAGLKDLGNNIQYVVPWYGKMTPSLETVYDWLLDNELDFIIVSANIGKDVPKVLASKAGIVEKVEDVNYWILKALQTRDVPGISLILWDQENEEESVRLSSMSISMKLPTLELSNGLVPIIVDQQEPIKAPVEPVSTEDMPDIGETSYARETLEVMPTALVKRMAKDKGVVAKTKEEAIEFLSPKIEGPAGEIGSIIFLMKDGTEIGFNGTHELLKKIMDMVESHAKRW